MSALNQVAIVDYGAGNLFSVERACQFVGLEPIVTSDPKQVAEATAVVLPGVGAFGEAVSRLRKLDLESPLRDFVSTGRPFLGICLGMQLLFSESHEFGAHKGMGLIEGEVVRFPELSPNGSQLRVPAIGWNGIYPAQLAWGDSPLAELPAGAFMYFVHSFYVKPAELGDCLSLTSYEGFEYCSAVQRGNVTAMQFHPEKSGPQGIQIYANWARRVKSAF